MILPKDKMAAAPISSPYRWKQGQCSMSAVQTPGGARTRIEVNGKACVAAVRTQEYQGAHTNALNNHAVSWLLQ
ncbi:MAG: hypothetical protein RBR35_00690 [Salinivirgaceae bacterium]|nr:hypothetical protein [Salinivirgaceae bacterium]